MKTIRLLITKKCNNSCENCCNKNLNLDALPIFDDFRYDFQDMLIITGGEPLLTAKMREFIKTISWMQQTTIVYTSLAAEVFDVLAWVNGVTLTLHTQNEVEDFVTLNNQLLEQKEEVKRSLSLRLNIFNNVSLPAMDLSLWDVKDNLNWIENCPLPEHEIFMRLKQLF